MDKVIQGKAIAETFLEEIRAEVVALKGRPPCLAAVLVGNHAPSQIYVERKVEACEAIGMHSLKLTFDEHFSEKMLLNEIERLNQDPIVDGILVQLPLPEQIDSFKITRHIAPEKDVDGFHPLNMGKLLIGETDGFVPCTPLGIKVLLDHLQIDLNGKHAVVVGRSNIVSKPVAALLLQEKMSVTLTLPGLPDFEEICRTADILIVAIGQPKLITKEMVKEGAVVIDVGITKVPDPKHPKGGRIVGDVDFEGVLERCSMITPVPGGVGPMTIAMLLQNTLKSYLQRHS